MKIYVKPAGRKKSLFESFSIQKFVLQPYLMKRNESLEQMSIKYNLKVFVFKNVHCTNIFVAKQ